MAKTMRSVDTRFWNDTWVRKLNALDRYAFLYFLTNTHTTWCGVYELDISMAAFESGIDERDLLKTIIPRLKPKLIYIDGWVCIKNWQKYHLSGSGSVSPQQQKGLEEAWKQVPEEIRHKIDETTENSIPSIDPIGGVSPSSSTFASTSSSAPTVGSDSKSKMGEFKNVALSEEELKQLYDKLGEQITGVLIEELSGYLASTGKKYKSHYATLQNWARRRVNDFAKERMNAKPKMI